MIGDPHYVAMTLNVEYDKSQMSDRMHEAIQRLMREAAAGIVAKASLLANAEVLKAEATEWDAEKCETVPMVFPDESI